MPEAEKKKLVAGLLAGENPQSSSGADLKTVAKHVNTAYLRNLNMTKKKARSILTGKTSCTAVCTQLLERAFYYGYTDEKILADTLSQYLLMLFLILKYEELYIIGVQLF